MPIIGLFDSGVGGLSVLRAVRAQLPRANLLYFGDNAHIPYGPRPLAEVRAFSEAITRFLLDRGAQVIVVACNAASAAALKYLRATFPDVPFVGMEPAVKPAAEQTQTRVVGVLATPATFQGELFNSVVERFAQGVTVLPQVCPGLVQQIEAGELDSPETEAMLRGWVEPMLAQNIDALVLGCTHYPFVIPTLERICGPGVRVIDPAPAVARQVERVVSSQKSEVGSQKSEGRLTYFTSGEPESFRRMLQRLGVEESEVRGVRWEGGEVTEK
jgi:glutamate racemase